MNRREATIAALIMALALFAAFGPDLISGKFLFIRIIEDPNNLFSFYPWDIFSARMCHAGRFPLYNPFNGCGVPHLANYQSAPLYPLHLLLFIHPTRLAFDLFMMLRLFLLGYGTYFLARRLGLSNMASIGAMLAASFNGFFMRYQAMVHLNVEILIPWAMLFALDLHERRLFRNWAILVGVIAAGLLGGNAESAFFLIFITITWSIWLGVGARHASPLRFNRTSSVLISIIAIFSAGLIALAQLLPFFEYLPHTWHIHAEGAGTGWLDARGIVSIAAPCLFGSQVGFAPYAGAVVLMLAVIGSARDRKTWFFLIMALFLFALIYGPPGTKWLTRLPGFDRMASYKYAFAPLGVVLAILAGRGIESIIAGETTAGRARRAATAIAVFIALFIAGGWITGRGMMLTSAAAAFIGLAFAAIFASFFANRRSVQVCAPALVAILWLELMAHFYGLAPRSLLDPDQLKNAPQIAYLTREGKLGRVAASVESGVLPDLNLLWGVADVGLFDAVYPKAYVRKMGEAFGFTMPEATKYFKTHAYSFPISPSGVESQVWRDLGVRYYLGRDLNPTGMVTAAPFLWEDYSSKPLMEADRAALEPITADEWRHSFGPVATQLRLIARYNYLPGWRAWLGGREIRIGKAGDMLMMLEIPQEGGKIHLRYLPWGWKVGMWATLAGLLSLTALILRNTLINRRKTA